MKKRMRLSGIGNKNTREWISWAKYSNDIFITATESPSKFKDLSTEEFVVIQMLAQRNGFKDIRWEKENRVNSVEISNISRTKPRVSINNINWR